MSGLNPPPTYYTSIPWNYPSPYTPVKYHNLGQLQTPYFGKSPSALGDYGPPQGIDYYTLENPNYIYPLWNPCTNNKNSYYGLNTPYNPCPKNFMTTCNDDKYR